MVANNISTSLKFKMYSDEYIIRKLDRCFTCEEQDIELFSLEVIRNGNGTSNVNLVLRINDSVVTLKKHFPFTKVVDRYELGDERTSDEAQLEILKDLIGFNTYKICKLLVMQQ